MQTDDKQRTKIEIGNSKLGSAQPTAQVSNGPWRVSTDSRQSTKIENGNAQPACAPTASRASGFGLRVSSNSPYLTAQQLQFLLRITPPALDGQRQYEIPACVTIAQAILESATAAGWGSSSLFRLANNPFGIKYEHFGSTQQTDRVRNGENPSPDKRIIGPTHPLLPADQAKTNHQITGLPDHPITRSPDHPVPEPYGAFDAQTWEIVNGQKEVMIAQFQRFPNLTEAFIAHAQLLQGPRYRPAFAVRQDWKQFAERLGPKTSPLDSEHCGYSTNPSYSAELIKLVAIYRLDDPRALQWFATGKDPGHQFIEPSNHLAIGLSDH